VTSALDVDHRTSPGNTPVEPDDSEIWTITAHWRPLMSSCAINDRSYSVDVTVTWDSTNEEWTATCGDCGSANPINDVDICKIDSCTSGGGVEHSWKYNLIVDLDIENVGGSAPTGGILHRVVYEAREEYIDDGDTLNTTSCSEVSVVSPIDGVTATDYGPFTCAHSCAASGQSATIYYQ
jgi:hypothetical protein